MRILRTGFVILLGVLLMTDTGYSDEPVIGDLPFGITSFGAGVENGWLYVYGGNAAEAHHYYREGQNDQVLRVSLESGGAWEQVGSGPNLQGLGMIAYEGGLYRIGGLMALNSREEEQKLVSIAEVSRFDVETNEWQELPPLPEPRSSFDSVVVDGVIYVIGGWTLGDDAENWLDTAWSLDLKAASLEWTEIASTPFKRRALAVGQLGNRIYAIGGMAELGGPSVDVDIYDIESNQWERGPALPGEGMVGFGASAFLVGDKLVVSGSNGKLLSLTEGDETWQEVADLPESRFFHRMLPWGDDHVVIVGGTSRGKKTSVFFAKTE